MAVFQADRYRGLALLVRSYEDVKKDHVGAHGGTTAAMVVFQADRYRGLAVLVRSCRDVNKDAASFFPGGIYHKTLTKPAAASDLRVIKCIFTLL
jgi:hypothetical protein